MDTIDYETYINLISNKEFEKACAYKNSIIPNKLFKYYSLDNDFVKNDSKLDYLESMKIKLCSLNSFNDPFESNFFLFSREKLREKKWKKEKVMEYYYGLLSNFKVTCMANTNEQNMPMWAYYSNMHRGYCVEYELGETEKKYVYPVSYEEKRQSADSLVTNTINALFEASRKGTDLSGDTHVRCQMLLLSMAAKHISWKHENEFRIITTGDEFSLRAKKIFIGLYCKDSYAKRICSLADNIKCEVYRMTIDDDNPNFELQSVQCK